WRAATPPPTPSATPDGSDGDEWDLAGAGGTGRRARTQSRDGLAVRGRARDAGRADPRRVARAVTTGAGSRPGRRRRRPRGGGGGSAFAAASARLDCGCAAPRARRTAAGPAPASAVRRDAGRLP